MPKKKIKMDAPPPKPILSDRRTDRQTRIILSAFGLLLCIMLLAVGVLSWPLVKQGYPLIAAWAFPLTETARPAPSVVADSMTKTPSVSSNLSTITQSLIPPTATVRPTKTALPGYIPHRIGVRVVDGVGEFYDRLTGEKFIPRGYNYVRLSPINGTSGQMWEETLAPGMYDPALAEQALREMHADGYNVVRVVVDCCRPGKNIGNLGGGISQAYVSNIIDFLQKAKSNEIQVLLVLHLAAGDGGYSRYWESARPKIDKLNLFYLAPGGYATKRYYDQDLIRALIKRHAPLDTILAYDLMNDVAYDFSGAPLTTKTGLIKTANGKTYDMAKPEDKQKMMNENLVFWIDHQRSAILDVDPTALVTVSFHGFLNRTGAEYARAALSEADADFFDLHLYFGTGYMLEDYVNKFDINSLAAEKPVIIGQLAAARQGYPSAVSAAEALTEIQADSCRYGFDGWILWLRGSEEHTALWNGPTDGGIINDALAPVNRPDPCEKLGD